MDAEILYYSDVTTVGVLLYIILCKCQYPMDNKNADAIIIMRVCVTNHQLFSCPLFGRGFYCW